MTTQDLRSNLKSVGIAGTGITWRMIILIVLALAIGFSLTYYFQSQAAPEDGPPGAGPVLAEFGTEVCQSGQCGDGVCLQGFGVCSYAQENCENCPVDCGICEPEVICGNGICENGEGAWNCVADCGNFCGDQVCAAEEVDSCCGAGLDCTVAITCGDGICSACESAGNCPTDCEGVETQVPTEEVTETPTEEVTDVPVVTEAVTETEEPTEAPTETPTATATETPTATATETETPSPTPEPEDECGLVPYESRPGGWKQSYGGASEPGDYIPINDENLEVYVCDEPPAETICIPLYGDLLDVADGDEARVQVVDCPDGGECRVYEQVARVVGDEVCFNPTETSGISCGVGCAFAPLLLEPTGPQLPLPLWALGLILLLLLLLLLLLFIALSRRRREADEEEAGME